ncbi:MAG TPA: peptidoglycan editing factor PgeF [Firmicutes bacterium]|nr:peptidoglycan editing factor PgeF [Bacillota bacterium]
MKGQMRRISRNDITYFYFPGWEEKNRVGHGFSSRCGGVSADKFASLNLGYKGGDNPAAILENRRRFLNLWGKKEPDLVYGEQVHGTNIQMVGEKKVSGGVLPATDGLITAERGVVLGAFSADCILAYLWDPYTHTIGLVHAGWRGTLEGIVFLAVTAMQNYFAARPAGMQALLAPSIGPCCYKVGRDVIGLAAASSWRNEAIFYPSARDGHAIFDLRASNRNILIAAGLVPGNIMVSTLCTCCHSHYFYSYRRAGRITGSHMGILFLY